MIRLAPLSFAVLLLSSCASAAEVSPAARSELAPTGKLRVGINVQNFLLVNKERPGGEYGGIAVDLGRELGRRLGVPVELVAFDTAGKLADAVKAGAWDVAFLGSEPSRENEIAFSAAYLEVEAGYLVPAGSPIRTIAEVDREGVRVAVNAKSAYDLYLTRNLQRAKLFRAPTVDASYELFVADKLDALAGLKPRLVMDAEKLSGSRVLEGRFSAVQQAIGTPQGRPSGAKYLREFAEDAKASGFVAKAIERHAVRGVSVAPPAPAS
jgi:polar amino acid transport system substrate-binding protein